MKILSVMIIILGFTACGKGDKGDQGSPGVSVLQSTEAPVETQPVEFDCIKTHVHGNEYTFSCRTIVD